MKNNRYIDIGQHCSDAIKAVSFDIFLAGVLFILVVYLVNYQYFITSFLSICLVLLIIVQFIRWSHQKRLVVSECGLILMKKKHNTIKRKTIKWNKIIAIKLFSQKETGINANIQKLTIFVRNKHASLMPNNDIEIIEIDLLHYLTYSPRGSNIHFIKDALENVCKKKNVSFSFESS